MIQRVNQFIPFGAPESPVRRLDARDFSVILEALTTKAPADDGLAEVLQGSFRLKLLEALSRLAPPSQPLVPPAVAPPPSATSSPVPPAPAAQLDAEANSPTLAAPRTEDAVLKEVAQRTGIDPRFLQALRRAENGGPGREFGVVSVPAPTYEDQARVAAETVRRNVERFEQTGGQAVDPISGRYTEEFIRFFSNRYAPIGATNDPNGLNRYHARNLIRLYAQLALKA